MPVTRRHLLAALALAPAAVEAKTIHGHAGRDRITGTERSDRIVARALAARVRSGALDGAGPARGVVRRTAPPGAR